jgi:hypothetical protein
MVENKYYLGTNYFSDFIKIQMKLIKEQNSQEESKHIKTPAFDNDQMYLHLYEIFEAIKLKFSQEESFTVTFQNTVIPIDLSTIEIAFAYEELNRTYRLEAKTLIEEIISRIGSGYPHITENLMVDFLKEIIKQKKLHDEKEAFNKKVVWVKK